LDRVKFALVGAAHFFESFDRSTPNLGAEICKMVEDWRRASPALPSLVSIVGLRPDPFEIEIANMRSQIFLGLL